MKKDIAAGFVLLIGLVIIADDYMATGLFMPGLERGSVRYSEILLVFLFFAHAGVRRDAMTRMNVLRSRLIYYWMAFLVLMLVSIIRSPEPLHNFLFSFRHVGLVPMLVFMIASSGFSDIKDYRKFIFYMTFLVIILNVAQFQQIFFDKVFIESTVFEKAYSNISHSRRFFSFFGNPNMLGCFYVTIFPLVLVFMIITKGAVKKGVIFLLLMITLFCFFKTYSRGSYVGMGVALIPFVFLKVRNINFAGKMAVVVLLLASILIFSPGIYESVLDRAGTVVQTSQILDAPEKLSRADLWKNILVVLRHNMIVGIGWGETRFREKIYEYLGEMTDQDIAMSIYEASHPHNSYLYIAVFMGVIALFVFLLMVKNIIVALFKLTRKSNDSDLEMICLGLFSGVLGFLVVIFFDYQLFVKSNSVSFWVLVGLAVSFYGVHRENFRLNVSESRRDV